MEISSLALTLSALIISGSTLILGAIGLRHKAATSYVEMLRSEMDLLRSRVSNCETGRDQLQELNEALRKRVAYLEGRLMDRRE